MKKIMVAPLNWGLGHATRCIPIIHALLEQEFEVLLASDGSALHLLKKEFPDLESIELPSYSIKYPSKGSFFKWKMLSSLPRIYKAMIAEEKIVKEIAAKGEIDGIISDGRFGTRASQIPSVYITHQLNVLTGSTTYLSSKLHQRVIKKFDVCWVPDVNDAALNHSGVLGHLKESSFPIRYFGIVSRMKKTEKPITIDILALISGPEPQRTYFEKKLKKILEQSDKRIIIVRGIVEEEQIWTAHKNISIVNFMQSEELEETINKSELVISRSGYTTIMDLTILKKKVFFIPTPGQYEQEYLASRLKEQGITPFSKQKEFKLDMLNEVAVYKGLKSYTHTSEEFSKLFSIFHRE